MKHSFGNLGKCAIVTDISLGTLSSCNSDDDFALNTDLYRHKQNIFTPLSALSKKITKVPKISLSVS